MRINLNYNSFNFGRVYAVAGSKKKMQKFLSKIDGEKNIITQNATDLYLKSDTDGLCSKEAKKGNEIYFVVTGKKDCDKVKFMTPGWGSINGISKQLDEFILLDNIEKSKKIITSAGN